jgi:DNA-directed RNA polymerase subunit K/omega
MSKRESIKDVIDDEKLDDDIEIEEDNDIEEDSGVEEEPIEPSSSDYFKMISIVPIQERVTSDIMSYYEFSEVIGIRTTHIENGSTVYTKVDNSYSPRQMALKELFDRKCPLKVRRQVGKKIEIWKCSELAIPAQFRSYLDDE